MSMTSRRVRQLALAGSALALVTTLPSLAASTGTTSWTLPSVVPSFAHGIPAAVEPATASVYVEVQLRGRDNAGLARFARAVSTPGNAAYRHFLTHAQLRARYAPTSTAANTVTGWLRTAGLTVDRVSADRDLVAAHGPAALVAAAFGTAFAQFDVDGKLLRAPITEAHLPAVGRALCRGRHRPDRALHGASVGRAAGSVPQRPDRPCSAVLRPAGRELGGVVQRQAAEVRRLRLHAGTDPWRLRRRRDQAQRQRHDGRDRRRVRRPARSSPTSTRGRDGTACRHSRRTG